MKKLLLVNTNIEKFPYPIPPIGLSLLASYLAPFYDVRVYDGVFDEGKSLPDLVRSYKPDFIGFSIRNIDDVVADKTIFYMERILEDFIRPVRELTEVPVILGGSGFSVFPEEVMAYTGADYGVIGEGEEVILRLLKSLEAENELPDLPNLVVKNGKNRAKSPPNSFLVYHSIPFSQIDRHIDFNPYKQRGVYSIQTKRGCALGCIYCTYPSLEGKTYRLRDPDDVAREIEEAMDRVGRVTFEFVDSTFNEPAGHAENICRAIIRRKLNPQLRTMGVNPRYTSRELFDLMMEAGFTQIDITPDSAAPVVIRNLNKGFTRKDIERTASLVSEYNLPTMWFFLFGGPGETPETVRQSRDFIDQHIGDEDMVLMLAGLRIYPNTPLEKIALKEGVVREGELLFHPSPYYFSVGTPKSELDRMLLEIRDTHHNCLPASESSPPPEMIQKAIALRKERGLTEPMFRTLLRIRKDIKSTEL
ncbi:MAG: radical SAM protein [Bacteroidales bacterium]|nr:radical SAM protein [Bacteroidales bacterium]